MIKSHDDKQRRGFLATFEAALNITVFISHDNFAVSAVCVHAHLTGKISLRDWCLL